MEGHKEFERFGTGKLGKSGRLRISTVLDWKKTLTSQGCKTKTLKKKKRQSVAVKIQEKSHDLHVSSL